MKLTLAAVLAILLSVMEAPSYAQGFGVSGGVALSKVVASACQVAFEPCDLEFRPAVSVGVFAPFGWGNGKAFGLGSGKYVFQPELRFAMKGGKTAEGGLRGTAPNDGIKSTYLQFPMLAKINVPVRTTRVFVYLGPSFDLLLSAKSEGEDFKDNLNKFDFEAVFGGGVQISDRIGVEARFEQSFFDILTKDYRTSVLLDETATAGDQRFNRYNNRTISFLVDVSLGK